MEQLNIHDQIKEFRRIKQFRKTDRTQSNYDLWLCMSVEQQADMIKSSFEKTRNLRKKLIEVPHPEELVRIGTIIGKDRLNIIKKKENMKFEFVFDDNGRWK